MQFFTPGRTEIIGNHTDHQLGRVIASAVSIGIRAEAEKSEDGWIRVCSRDCGEFAVCVEDTEPRPEERGTTAALLRGLVAAYAARGYRVGGFRCSVSSELPIGGGLSSSAAFTVLMGKILNTFYNDKRILPGHIAECARDAENMHFGKPSGLMDQMACAVGQAVYMDFRSGEIQTLQCGFAAMGLVLCLTDTGGSHAGLTEAYGEITADMRSVAAEFGVEQLGYVNHDVFFKANRIKDRAHDRAQHFFEENARVSEMRSAILAGDRDACLALMNASGRSSECLLRNIRAEAGDDRLERGLALAKELLEGKGAWRVHGGGFAGCVQALVPVEEFDTYCLGMEHVFGRGSCNIVM